MRTAQNLPVLTTLHTADVALASGDVAARLTALHRPQWVVRTADGTGLVDAPAAHGEDGPAVVGMVPAVPTASLGDAAFLRDYGVAHAYVAGAMAGGIASADLVIAMAKARMLGFFGAAGLSPERVEDNIRTIKAAVGPATWGVNLIHAPHEPHVEERVGRMLVEHGVPAIEASAYLRLTPAVVRTRYAGIREENGQIVLPRRLMAKVSRVEVAERFLRPAPDKMLAALVADGSLTEAQAALARRVPMCDDLTAEADSGGHTDNRPAMALLPTMVALRDRLRGLTPDWPAVRVGLGGGLSTPQSLLGAFAMGAGYVVTGSVNQACVEAGTSDIVRDMLANAAQADVAMAPAADMFEMGVKVQVLRRGTMFAMRASKLYELYKAHANLDAIAPDERARLEKQIFRMPLSAVWDDCVAFFTRRDPRQLERAARDEKHKMALVFRWYLGQASRWATSGDKSRQMDFQVWCGQAMGAFNAWSVDTHFAAASARKVADVAHALLVQTAILKRAAAFADAGGTVPDAVAAVRPLSPAENAALLG